MPKKRKGSSENLVLDSFALLSFLRKEKGASQVQTLLEEANKGKKKLYFCWLNLGEICYKVLRECGEKEADAVLALIRTLPIQFVSIDDPLVFGAAKVKAAYPVSFADCFAVATAQRFSAGVVTGDPDFKKLEDLVEVVWVG